MDSDQISAWIDQMDKESTSIRQEALKMTWFMRGGLSYDQALQLSQSERELVNKIVKENLETTKKTGLPFY